MSEKVIMVEISKRTIVFLVIAALLIGSVGTIFILRHGAGGNVMMSEDEYEELTAFKEEYEKLDEIKWFLSNHYYTEVDETKLMESAYYGLVDGLGDKYSGYISADDYADYLQSLFGTGTYYGVGLTFLNDPVESGYYVMAVNTKGPAYALGARKGDIIVSVDGVSALTMNGDELRDSIRGELGTTVTVGLLRGDSVIELTITRAEIPTESVVYEMLDDDIAYIAISEFISDTGKDFASALEKAEAAGAKGLIVDLRDNGGGLVSASIAVADELMEKGVVVSTIDHDGRTNTYTTSAGRTSLPYVVLINGNTASASEILSAGIQDNKEGIIIGTLSFGKGIIQNVMTLSDGSAVKYTELQYLSPNGNPIHGVGITPDIEIDLTEDCYDEHGFLVNDVQLNKAIEVLKEGF